MTTVRFPPHIYMRRADSRARQRVTMASGDGAAQHLVAYGGPLERVADAPGEAVPGPPAQQANRPSDPGVGARDVAGPPGGLARLDRMVGDLVERGEEFPDRGAGAAAEVDRGHRPGQG